MFTYAPLDSIYDQQDHSVKEVFDSTEATYLISDVDLPVLVIFDFSNENDVTLAYFYPALDPYEKPTLNLIPENSTLISDFAKDFQNGKLHPTLNWENISQTYLDFPLQKQMFENDFPNIKKINVKTLNDLVHSNKTFNAICIVCELYWAPCIDRLYEIQEKI